MAAMLPPSAQSNAPLVEALLRTAPSIRAPFLFPGHKMGAATPAVLRRTRPLLRPRGGVERLLRYDLPELAQLGELLSDEGPVWEAERLAASAFGARRTWFLINGSTAGVLAATLACVQVWRQAQAAAGGKEAPLVLLPRNAHKSAVHALIASGAEPSWLIPGVRPPRTRAPAEYPEPVGGANLYPRPSRLAAVLRATQAQRPVGGAPRHLLSFLPFVRLGGCGHRHPSGCPRLGGAIRAPAGGRSSGRRSDCVAHVPRHLVRRSGHRGRLRARARPSHRGRGPWRTPPLPTGRSGRRRWRMWQQRCHSHSRSTWCRRRHRRRPWPPARRRRCQASPLRCLCHRHGLHQRDRRGPSTRSPERFPRLRLGLWRAHRGALGTQDALFRHPDGHAARLPFVGGRFPAHRPSAVPGARYGAIVVAFLPLAGIARCSQVRGPFLLLQMTRRRLPALPTRPPNHALIPDCAHGLLAPPLAPTLNHHYAPFHPMRPVTDGAPP
jgi:hypothetical protein